MVTIGSLWLPILLSAAGVFVMSALVWTALPWHKSDYRGLPDEPAARAALAPQDLSPGTYNIPHARDRGEYKTEEVRQRYEEGPVAFLTVLPRGLPGMGRSMALGFVFYVVVGIVVAYLAGRTLAPGAEYLTVFRVAGTVAWVAHGFGTIPDAIWFGRPWSTVVKYLFDAFLYALVTAGFFAALWP